MTMQIRDVETARHWIEENCHRADVRRTLMRAIEYVEAIERAGLIPNNTVGDDLYDFLTDPMTASARTRSFVEPTL